MLACFNVTEKIILVHVYILIHKLTIVTDNYWYHNYGEKQHGFFFIMTYTYVQCNIWSDANFQSVNGFECSITCCMAVCNFRELIDCG